MTERFKELMKLHGITYAELGAELNRAPATVKQRLNTEATFHKYADDYKVALRNCIIRKDKEKEIALEELM